MIFQHFFTSLKKKLYISRDVIFFENESFFKEDENELENHITTNDFTIPLITNQIEEQEFVGNNEDDNEGNNASQDTIEEEKESEPEEEEIPLRRSTRPTRPPTKLRDFVTNKVQYPIENYISYKNVFKCHNVFLTSISKIEELILNFTKHDYMDSKEKIDDFLENRLDDKLFEFIFKSIDINGTKVFAFGDENAKNTILYMHGGAYVNEINYQHHLKHRNQKNIKGFYP